MIAWIKRLFAVTKRDDVIAAEVRNCTPQDGVDIKVTESLLQEMQEHAQRTITLRREHEAVYRRAGIKAATRQLSE